MCLNDRVFYKRLLLRFVFILFVWLNALGLQMI